MCLLTGITVFFSAKMYIFGFDWGCSEKYLSGDFYIFLTIFSPFYSRLSGFNRTSVFLASNILFFVSLIVHEAYPVMSGAMLPLIKGLLFLLLSLALAFGEQTFSFECTFS
jgi:hypothetical protein